MQKLILLKLMVAREIFYDICFCFRPFSNLF